MVSEEEMLIATEGKESAGGALCSLIEGPELGFEGNRADALSRRHLAGRAGGT
jgi:hypothetical protein